MRRTKWEQKGTRGRGHARSPRKRPREGREQPGSGRAVSRLFGVGRRGRDLLPRLYPARRSRGAERPPSEHFSAPPSPRCSGGRGRPGQAPQRPPLCGWQRSFPGGPRRIRAALGADPHPRSSPQAARLPPGACARAPSALSARRPAARADEAASPAAGPLAHVRGSLRRRSRSAGKACPSQAAVAQTPPAILFLAAARTAAAAAVEEEGAPPPPPRPETGEEAVAGGKRRRPPPTIRSSATPPSDVTATPPGAPLPSPAGSPGQAPPAALLHGRPCAPRLWSRPPRASCGSESHWRRGRGGARKAVEQRREFGGAAQRGGLDGCLPCPLALPLPGSCPPAASAGAGARRGVAARRPGWALPGRACGEAAADSSSVSQASCPAGPSARLQE